MKMIEPVVVFCLLTSLCLAQVEPFTPKLDIREKVEITHPLIQKVFPNVRLVEAYDYRENSTKPALPAQYTFAYYDSVRYPMPDQINMLYAKMGATSSATVEERIRAYIMLAFWAIDPNAEFLEFSEGYYKRHSFEMNYRILLRINPKHPTLKYRRGLVEIYLLFQDNEFKFAETWQQSEVLSATSSAGIHAGVEIKPLK